MATSQVRTFENVYNDIYLWVTYPLVTVSRIQNPVGSRVMYRFRGSDNDNENYIVAAKVRKRLSVNKW